MLIATSGLTGRYWALAAVRAVSAVTGIGRERTSAKVDQPPSSLTFFSALTAAAWDKDQVFIRCPSFLCCAPRAPLTAAGREGTRMMMDTKLRALGFAALIIALAGCGGEGGTPAVSAGMAAVSSTPSPAPTPTPSPTPTPAPTPTTSPLPPAPFGLTANQAFATIGWVQTSERQPVLPTGSADLAFAWVASPGTYEVQLPGYEPARLFFTFPGNNPAAFSLRSLGGASLDRGMVVLTQGKFSGTAHWFAREGSGYPNGQFGFGIPTAPGAVLAATSRTYATSSDSGPLYALGSSDGQLVFNPRDGTVSGYFDVAYTDAWGPYPATRYSLASSSYTPGSPTFTATFEVPGAPFIGVIEGQFTGPQAQELILRWKAPVREPYDSTWQQQIGVRLGWLG